MKFVALISLPPPSAIFYLILYFKSRIRHLK